jgi:hypothetical protein
LSPASVVTWPAAFRADHRGAHEQRRLERLRRLRSQHHLLVLDVHERVAAALQLSEQVAHGILRTAAGAGAG